jgi:hypothetical protein
MNNILTFEDYKKMNIRQVESVIYHQFIEEDIKDESEINEGFIRDAINKSAGKFIQNALADEIEKGKELEKSIKEALDGLNKGFEDLESRIDADTERGNNASTKLSAIEKVKEAIKAVQSQAFDTLTMIGSEGEIDFAGFMGSASVAAAANFGILFSPIRSVFMTRKAYKYFLGIIKQTIRRNLLIIQLNFDQFENLILQKSFETEDDSETMTKSNALHEIIGAMQAELCGDKSKMFNKKKGKEMKEYLEAFKKAQDIAIKQNRENTKNNPLRSLWEDQHNNTYTRTLEQIKQYINEDSQKELDALKNSITKMAGNDVELGPYGELLIAAAEEYAVHTNHGINNNFIKMSSVFNLDNQKKLIDLIVAAQKENEEEIQRKLRNKNRKDLEEKLKKEIEKGKELYEEKLKNLEKTYTFDKFENEFSGDDIKSLSAYLASEDGQEAYKDLIKKNPLYKYILDVDISELNTLLRSINDLTIIKISDIDNFYSSIVNKEQALYYIMADRSIKDAVKSIKSEEYFGIENIKDVDASDHTLISDRGDALLSAINVGKRGKKKYFLTFNGNGNGLFDILHKDFKTKIFKGNEYVNNISIENKETLMKIIYKKLKIGNSVSSLFAEYLVRLEAHMLLEQQDNPWFVVENNDELLQYFKPKSKKILNKNAFVEMSQDDYEKIEPFLTKYHIFSDSDFDIETETKKEENK